MESEIRSGFRDELRSFFALAVMNIVFAAMTMAIGIATAVTRLQQAVGAGGLTGTSPVFLVLGSIAAAVGIWWLVASAGILSGITDIRRAGEGNQGPIAGDEELRLMVRMMALYRKNREKARLMMIFARIGGAVFLALGFVSLIRAFSSPDTLTLYLGIAGGLLNIVIGAVALGISVLFDRFSRAWEVRLAESEKAQVELTATFGRT